MRILIVQKEETDFNASKSWAFHSQIGWYKAALALGFEVDIYFTTFGFSLEEFLLSNKPYDICICNCILHLLKDSNPSLTSSDINCLRKYSKHLIGFTIEQSHYYDSKGTLFEFAKDRINGVEHYLHYFDAIGVFYSPDIEFFKNKVKHVFSIGPTIPYCYLQTKPLTKLELFLRRFRKKVLMLASIYGEREHLYTINKKFIKLGKLSDADLAKQFSYTINKMQLLTSFKHFEANALISQLVQIKENYFDRYIKLVRRHQFLLHPPAFFSGLHCRFIEALVAKSICIHPEIAREVDAFPLNNNILFYFNAEQLFEQLEKIELPKKDYNIQILEEYTTEFDLKRIIKLIN